MGAAIAGSTASVVARRREATEHAAGFPVIGQLVRISEELAGEAGTSTSELACIVIGIPAVVSPQTGLASLSPNLKLPEDVPLAALIEERVGCPVIVENDVNLSAFGEAEVAEGTAQDPLAFVSFGTGAGMGLVVAGEMIRGARGAAGEIAYLPVGDSPHEKVGKSENGLYEDAVGTPGIRARYTRGGEDVVGLFSRAGAGETDAIGAIDAIARSAAVGLAAVQNLLDPSVIVIGGGIGSQIPFFEKLVDYVAPLCPSGCTLEPSRFGSEAGMMGAVHFALHNAKKLAEATSR